jgi:predicted transcriptional regulator
VFRAAIDRDALIGLRLRELADTLCDGSLSPLFTHLVHQKLSRKERDSLRALVDELDKSQRQGR